MFKQIYILLALVVLSLPFVSALTVDVLSTDPAPLVAGEFADITLQIESSGSEDDYNDVKVIIEETNILRQISSGDAEFEIFRSGTSSTKTFRVFLEEDIPEGYIDLQIRIDTDKGSFDFEERVFIQESESNPEIHIGSINTVPQELLPDTDDNKLTITLQNLGDKDAELVKATLKSNSDLISSSYSFSLEDSVASIDSGEEKEFSFTIDIDEAATGTIPSMLELRYRTESSSSGSAYETLTTTVPLNIEIIDAPLLKIVEVNQVSDFIGGTPENKVLVGVKNEGTEDAEEVRVRVVPDISYPFLFETTTQYVSSKIKPGETAYVSFTTEVTGEAESRSYDITTKLESLVGETRYTREDVLSLETQPGQEVSLSKVGGSIIAIVIVIAGIIGVRTYRARKKAKKRK